MMKVRKETGLFWSLKPLAFACSVIACSTAFPVTAFSMEVEPDISHIGSVSPIIKQALDRSRWQSSYHSDHLATEKDMDFLIINAGHNFSDAELEDIQDIYLSGVPLLVDGSSHADKENQIKLTESITGMGLDDPVVFVRYRNNSPEFRVVSMVSESATGPVVVDGAQDDTQSVQLPEVTLESVPPSGDEQFDLFSKEVNSLMGEWLVSDSAQTQFGSRGVRTKAKKRVRKAETPSGAFKPEITIPLEVRAIGGKCMVGHLQGWGWKPDKEDACKGQMSVSLFYDIDLIRSVPFSGGGDNSADDAKYIRITLDPKTSGGAGWHLADRPYHKHSWFQSWTMRDTLFAPIAGWYETEIKSNSSDVRLFQHAPNNVPRQHEVRETTGFTVGVNAKVSGGISEEGPKLGGEVGGSFSYNSSRMVTYNVREYEVTNKSRAASDGDVAKWTWDRNYKAYHKDWANGPTDAVWGKQWLWKDHAFSPASYANYKPGMTATFRAEASKTGTTSLTLSNRVAAVGYGGKVIYAALYQTLSPGGNWGHVYNYNRNITVRWDAPVFDPEVPVSIEAYKYDSSSGTCLDVVHGSSKAGMAVIPYACHYQKNQIWGLDSEQRYRSKVAPDRCLHVEEDKSLTVRSCTASARQKWRWEGDVLFNELGGRLALVNGELKISDDPGDYESWKNYIRNNPVSDVLTVR